MGTSLTGLEIKDTYDGLVKTTDNGPISATAKYLSDGLGNDSVLALSTARVGVGTASPVVDFQVNGAAEVTQAFSVAGTRYLQIYTDGTIGTINGLNSAPLVFSTSTGTSFAERMRITSAGNVGIGTTAPAEKLSVAGAIITTGAITGHGANRVSISQEGANGAFIQSYGANTSTVGNFTFRQASSDFSVAQIPLAITAAGNVGIGISAPAVKLDVVGDIRTSTGILFGSDTAAANALDDYEEGTWTMGVSFGGASVAVTTSGNTGTYTKIGRQVTVNGRLSLTSKGSSSGSASITGLPFTIPNSESNRGVASLRFADTSFANQFQSFAIINSTTIRLEEITEAGTASSMDESNFTNSSDIMISFTYFV